MDAALRDLVWRRASAQSETNGHVQQENTIRHACVTHGHDASEFETLGRAAENNLPNSM